MAELYPNDLFENAIPMSSFRYLAPSNSEQFEAAIGNRKRLDNWEVRMVAVNSNKSCEGTD